MTPNPLESKVAKKLVLCENVRPPRWEKKLGARRQLSRLAEIEERLRESRRELLIAREHETIQAELASEAGFKMLVADTPGASLAYRKADAGLVKARNELDAATAGLEQLTCQRDDLLKAIPEPISSSG